MSSFFLELCFVSHTVTILGLCSVNSIHLQILKLLDELHYWTKFNSMFIHPTKTEVMFMSKTPFIGPLRPITYESKLMNYVSRSSCFGVTLDNKLSWSPHINQSPASFNAKNTKLRQMKTFDRSTLESIYFKAILPSTTYCISLWGSSHLLPELEDSHIRAARLIHNLSPSIPKHQVLHKANWNSLPYLYKKRLACIVYQACYKQTPSSITKLFSKQNILQTEG